MKLFPKEECQIILTFNSSWRIWTNKKNKNKQVVRKWMKKYHHQKNKQKHNQKKNNPKKNNHQKLMIQLKMLKTKETINIKRRIFIRLFNCIKKLSIWKQTNPSIIITKQQPTLNLVNMERLMKNSTKHKKYLMMVSKIFRREQKC